MSHPEFGTVAWICSCDTHEEGDNANCPLDLDECLLCNTKRPPELAKLIRNGHEFTPKDVTLERDIPRGGFSVEVLEVVDTPLGPGWYWYKHDVTVDPCCIEVGLKGTDLIAIWKGLEVDIKQLTGKWQRVCPSAFHLPKVE